MPFTLSKDSAGVLSLITLKARREGEVLCPLRSLLFDTLSSLEGFLSEGGNKVLADRIIRVDGVVLDEAGGVSPVYMAVTGIGRFLRHFAGVRKSGPNAIIHVDCSKGAGGVPDFDGEHKGPNRDCGTQCCCREFW